MMVSVILLLLITLSGTVLTYFYETEDSLLFRLGAGNIIGSAFFGTIAFLLACLFGLSVVTILLSLFILLLPLILLRRKTTRERFLTDFGKAKGRLEGANLSKVLSFVYYAGMLLLLYFFFERAVFETKDGIFTGASQNLGDLPFHLGAIFSFTEGNNFPPENPSFANAKFTYPFIADFLTACLVKLGGSVRDAMLVQNVTLGFSLFVLFEKFAYALTKNRLAGKFAALILFFCGGLGFIVFFRDYSHDGRSIFEFIWNISADYTIRPKGIRWGNSLTTLFMTQRSLLLGMPITLIVLTWVWKIFNAETQSRQVAREEINRDEQNGQDKDFSPFYPFTISPFLIGLLAGTLPLIHVHSLVVLFFVSAFLFFFRLDKWREWLAFGVAVAIIAVPELLWAMTGSATQLTKFIGWNFGWDARDENILIFWAKNLGLFIPLLILAMGMIFYRRNTEGGGRGEEGEEAAPAEETGSQFSDPKSQILFYLPFAFIFIIANLVKLAPWEWDNIKVLIYWFVASVPFVAWFLAVLWEKEIILKIVAAGCLLVLTLSGALDVWRVVSRQIDYKVFDKDAAAIAEQIKQKTPPKALFLNAPTYNSAVVLSGRRSLMRYSGHLGSYGIDYTSREDEVKRIYEGSALAESFLRKNGIEYVIISPEENELNVNKAYFEKYPKIAEVGQYRVYKIK
jgi:hypothetical protein